MVGTPSSKLASVAISCEIPMICFRARGALAPAAARTSSSELRLNSCEKSGTSSTPANPANTSVHLLGKLLAGVVAKQPRPRLTPVRP